MKHLTNLPIGSRDIAIDMLGYLRPCVLNYCDNVSQYLCIMTYTIKSFQPKGDILVYGNPSS